MYENERLDKVTASAAAAMLGEKKDRFESGGCCGDGRVRGKNLRKKFLVSAKHEKRRNQTARGE